jgi:hypothetical protein
MILTLIIVAALALLYCCIWMAGENHDTEE